MNQSKLEVVKQEMARVNADILGISPFRWTGMGEFNSDEHFICYCGRESLRRKGVAITANKSLKCSAAAAAAKPRQPCPTLCDPTDGSPPGSCPQDSPGRNTGVGCHFQNVVLGCNLKNDRMISVHFQGKPFNIIVIQVYAPTSNAEEAEVEWFYDELTPKKDVLFITGDCNAKVGSQETPGATGKFGLGVQNEAGQRLIEFCQENALVIANTLFQKHKKRLHMDITRWSTPKQACLYSLQPKMEKLYTVSKKKTGS